MRTTVRSATATMSSTQPLRSTSGPITNAGRLAAPIAAAAFYMRYASLLPIGLLVLIAIVLWHDGLLRDPLLAAGTIVLFGMLLVPHALHAINETGTPWGIVTYATHSAGRRYVGQGLLQYLAWLPFALAGPVAGIALRRGCRAANRQPLFPLNLRLRGSGR